MWPGWSVAPGKAAAGWDWGFTEAIHKRMQVPHRLRVTGEDTSSSGGLEKKPLEDILPPSFQMHVPDRILLADTTHVAFRPFSEKQLQQQHRPLASDPLLEPSVQSAVFGECPFLSLASQSGSQKRKRPVHQGRARKERTLVGNLPLGPGGQRHECSQATSLALESPLEEPGATEIWAMRRQLAKISGRLQRLEEQRMGWRQKELLVCSVLMSAGLLNLWLWLRR